jgi:hypothetical protein
MSGDLRERVAYRIAARDTGDRALDAFVTECAEDERDHYRGMADAALSVVGPELARLEAEIAGLRKALYWINDTLVTRTRQQEDWAAAEHKARRERDEARAEVERLAKVYDDIHTALRNLLPPASVVDTSLDGAPIGAVIMRLGTLLRRAASPSPVETQPDRPGRRTLTVGWHPEALPRAIDHAKEQRSRDPGVRVGGVEDLVRAASTRQARSIQDSIDVRNGGWTIQHPLQAEPRPPRVWNVGDPEPEEPRPPLVDVDGDAWWPTPGGWCGCGEEPDTRCTSLNKGTWTSVLANYAPLTEVVEQAPAGQDGEHLPLEEQAAESRAAADPDQLARDEDLHLDGE